MATITNLVVTAYCACSICCGHDSRGICADGSKPIQGITVAGPRWMPFGTKLAIDGHKYQVADRTAKRYDGRVDIYFKRHADAVKFGKQTKTITYENSRGN